MARKAALQEICKPGFKKRKLENAADVISIKIKEEVMNEDPEIVLSNKGGPKLIHKGFMYTLHKRQPNSIRWRCVLRTYQCRGSLITNLECKSPFVRMCHSHAADYAAAEVARQRYKAFGEPLLQFFNSDGTLITANISKTILNKSGQKMLEDSVTDYDTNV